MDGAIGRLIALVEVAAQAAEGRPLEVAAGLTGLNGVIPPLQQIGQELHRRCRVHRLTIADDSLTSALGATNGTQGVVVAVGTGAVTLGIGPHGEVARVDGAGGFLGDLGSGWWIGHEGLIAAFSALDQRSGGSASLLELASRRFGKLIDLPVTLRADVAPFRTIAQFAGDVATAARAGDVVAQAIFRHAGGHLSTAVAAAAHRTNQVSGVPISFVGGISLTKDLFLPAFVEALEFLGIDGIIQQPAGDALAGAEALFAMTRLHTELVATWTAP